MVEKERTRAAQDPEIQAMQRIGKLLNGLGEEERARVVSWVQKKFNPETRAAVANGGVTFSHGLTVEQPPSIGVGTLPGKR